MLMAELLQPGSFSSIVCYEPILYDPAALEKDADRRPVKDQWSMSSGLLAKGASRRKRKFPSRAAAQQHFSREPPFDRFAPEALKAYVTHGLRDSADGVELKCKPKDEAAVYLEAGEVVPQIWPRVHEIQCPVAMVTGDDIFDTNPLELVAHSIRQTPAQSFQHGALIELEGLHHLGPFEDPKRVAACISSLLKSTPNANVEAQRLQDSQQQSPAAQPLAKL